jgi:hypothetical protein
MTDMATQPVPEKGVEGRVPSEPGSREPSPSVSAASGFDPSRVAVAKLRYEGVPEQDFERYYVAEAICQACVLFAYPGAPKRVVENLRDAFTVKCLPEAEAAINAVRELAASDSDGSAAAARPGTGLDPKDDSAGPEGIAQ